MSLVAVLDANVLFPAPVRDLLLHLAFLSAYQPKWSDRIQDEWIRSLLVKRPDLKKSQLDKTKRWMETVFPDARTCVQQSLLIDIHLPDENDLHVVETAITSRANVIVTFNIKDFPSKALEKYEIRVAHPDDFVCEHLKSAPDLVLKAFINQVKTLRKPPKTTNEVLAVLHKCGLSETEKQLRLRLSR